MAAPTADPPKWKSHDPPETKPETKTSQGRGVNLKLLNMFRVVAIMESSYLENYMRFSDSTATRFPNRI